VDSRRTSGAQPLCQRGVGAGGPGDGHRPGARCSASYSEVPNTRLALPTPCTCGTRRGGSRAHGACGALTTGFLDLPSLTPAHELVGAGTAPSSVGLGLRLPAPATALGDVFGNGAGSSASAATAPAPPPRRRFIVSRATLLANGVRRLEERNPTRLGLFNGHSNGVAPGTHLLGGSSSEEEEDGAPGPSTARR
jgi:hypothetical protein